MRDLFSIAGKTALVTGGSRGIGLMIARGFVEAGAKVYISSRKADVCDRAAAELAQAGTCVSVPADVSTEAGARGLADAVAAREQALDILVNNAGANWGAPLAEYPDSAWDKVLALNVKSVFHLSRFLLPLLEQAARPGDPARIINIGSIDGLHVPALETYAYSASKAAVHHLTRVLARRLAPRDERGIRTPRALSGRHTGGRRSCRSRHQSRCTAGWPRRFHREIAQGRTRFTLDPFPRARQRDWRSGFRQEQTRRCRACSA